MKDVGRVGKKPAENDRRTAIYQSVLNRNSLYYQMAIWFGRQEQEAKQLRLQESTCLIRHARNFLRSIRNQVFHISWLVWLHCRNCFFKRNANSCKLHLDKLKSYFYWWCRINQVAFKQDLSHSQDCLLVVPKSTLEEQFILFFIKTIAEKASNYRNKSTAIFSIQ